MTVCKSHVQNLGVKEFVRGSRYVMSKKNVADWKKSCAHSMLCSWDSWLLLNAMSGGCRVTELCLTMTLHETVVCLVAVSALNMATSYT